MGARGEAAGELEELLEIVRPAASWTFAAWSSSLAARTSSTDLRVRFVYWRTENIIATGGSVNAIRPVIPSFSYATARARASGPPHR